MGDGYGVFIFGGFIALVLSFAAGDTWLGLVSAAVAAVLLTYTAITR